MTECRDSRIWFIVLSSTIVFAELLLCKSHEGFWSSCLKRTWITETYVLICSVHHIFDGTLFLGDSSDLEQMFEQTHASLL